MKRVETVVELQALIQQEKKSGKMVGFVPTMGALHAGHISLVRQCRVENEFCVVSIFVNPTQFNNASDLKHYPRTMEADCALLEGENVDVVFTPTVTDVYPVPDTRQFDFGVIDTVMEGEHRPGHFNGVAQVVSRLFNIVEPDASYFGEKDFQQIAIIKEMVKQLELSVKVVACPIVREEDGLAMSSRNTRLTAEHRHVAPLIAQVLKASQAMLASKSVNEVMQYVIDRINAAPLLEVEYFDIVDALSLQSSKAWDEKGEKFGCIAVFAGDIRLIDNIRYS